MRAAFESSERIVAMDAKNWVSALELFLQYPLLLIATLLVACAAFTFALPYRAGVGPPTFYRGTGGCVRRLNDDAVPATGDTN
jgi:hypothetical protein